MKQLFIISLILLISCKQTQEKKSVPVIEQEEVSSEESHESIDGEVTLNNGELWQANRETTEGILKMKERIKF